MDDYNYPNNNQAPKRRGIFSYLLVALIGSIIGGIITAYIAPNYLYGKLLPLPEIYQSNTPSSIGNVIEIVPRDDISTVSAVAQKSMNSVVGITTVVIQRDWLWERPQEGVGSGVIVDSNGYILTNSHVIGDGKAKSINVLFENSDSLEGKVLWFDASLDLAIVKVDTRQAHAAELGDSDDLEVGELAVAIGNPLGLDFQRSVTSGVISGLQRSIRVDEVNVIEDLIQTDASINPGNSGGPLLNYKGEVIGINTAKIRSGEGLGFSIPINMVKPIIDEVIREGSFNNVYIGFLGEEVELYERRYGTELKADRGVVVLELIDRSPAAVAGLRILDTIVEIDNQPIESMVGLRKILYKYKLGDSALLKINRDGKILDIEIKFTDF